MGILSDQIPIRKEEEKGMGGKGRGGKGGWSERKKGKKGKKKLQSNFIFDRVTDLKTPFYHFAPKAILDWVSTENEPPWWKIDIIVYFYWLLW